jgi:hypothetical protein
MLKLTGTHYAYARQRQQITVAGGNIGVRHAFRIVVADAGVAGVGFRIGTAAGTDDVLAEVSLGTGQHIVSFVPVGNVWIELNHVGYDPAYVTSIAIVAVGDLTLTNSFSLGELSTLRTDQSGDVLYIGAGSSGRQQRKLIRRDAYSWSLELYQPIDGPFRNINAGSITLTPSATTGEITLTASKNLFQSGHVGGLFKLDSVAQATSDALSGANQFGSTVRVTGVGASRNVTLTITGTWVGTITLQRSVGETGSWVDVTTYTANQAGITYNDALDNQIIFYRLGFKAGNYTSGTATVALVYASGSNTGVVRITAITSGLVVSAVVLTTLGSTTATEDWYEGRWSDYRGWPSAPVFHEGRLYWLGNDRLVGALPDEFESFDASVEGDGGMIDRSIGSGPVDKIHWGMSLQRLMLGAGGNVFSARASSMDEPLTPTTCSIKSVSSEGSANIQAVRVNQGCVFVQRSKGLVYELAPDPYYVTHLVDDLTVLSPDICSVGVVALAVQQQPETRIHCVLADGSVALLVYDNTEKLRAWIPVNCTAATETIVGVVVLPGDGREDHVYYVVKSGTTYCLTKWALTSECQGASMNKQADLFVASTVSASSIAVPTFLNGRTFYIWADGVDRGTAVASAGSVALGGTYTNACVGLYYRARYKSAKLAYAAQLGTALLQKKNLGPLGLLLYNTHRNGIQYGRDFTTLKDLPETVRGATVVADTIHAAYDAPAFPMAGMWDTDARLCLQAASPRPCTVLAAVITVETAEKT